MSVYMLGVNTDVVKLGTKRFWAENGRICVEDASDNSFDTMSVKEALERLRAVNDFVGTAVRGSKQIKDDAKYLPFIERDQKFVEQMIALIKKAKEQGDPNDPAARREAKRRLPTSVRVPKNITDINVDPLS